MKVLLIHLCTYQLYMFNLEILKDNWCRGIFIDPIEFNTMKVLLIHLCTYQLYMFNLEILKDNWCQHVRHILCFF